MLILFLIISGITFIVINWESITSQGPTSSSPSNYVSSETGQQNAVVTCSQGEAVQFSHDRVRSLGHAVLGGGFTTLQSDDQNCSYVVQGMILTQQGSGGILTQMVVVKGSDGWRVNDVKSIN